MRGFGAVAAATCLGLSTLVFDSARSSHEFFYEVSQPIDIDDAGHFEIRVITYRGYTGSSQPGVEIRYTCSPGFVTAGTSASPGLQNRNAAFHAGVGLDVEGPLDPGVWEVEVDSTRTDSRGLPRRGAYVELVTAKLDFDTARPGWEFIPEDFVARRERELRYRGMEVDTAARRRIESSAQWAMERHRSRLLALADVTAECVLDNAARSRPPIRRIRIQCLGFPETPWHDTTLAVRPARKREFAY